MTWNRTDSLKNQSWSLSSVGDWNSFTENMVTTNRTHVNAHEVTAVGSNNLTHDVKGNLTTNVNSDTYTWDFDNQLSGPNTDGMAGDDVTFSYDALNRRVGKNNGTTNFVYVSNGSQVVSEYTSGTASTSPSEKFIYASYVDEPIQKIGTGGTAYYHRNAQYSVNALTDTSGAAIERYSYTAYGVPVIYAANGTTVRTSSSYANPYLYTGRRWDGETELYYFRARYFDAVLGRFVGRDPTGYVDGMSLYRGYFVPNNTDPSGTTVGPGMKFDFMSYYNFNTEMLYTCTVGAFVFNRHCPWNAPSFFKCSMTARFAFTAAAFKGSISGTRAACTQLKRCYRMYWW